jgi:beta-glucanase (GH16 family)
VQPPRAYTVRAEELLDNGDFARGLEAWSPGALADVKATGERTALRVTSSTGQSLKPRTIEPLKSYRLEFVARAADQSAGTVWVRFREPVKHETIRSFGQEVSDPASRPYALTFEAPAYSDLAEVRVEVARGAVIVDSLSLKMCPPTVHTEPVASWTGSFVPDGYGLVYNDEFNGAELNRKKWFTRFIYGSERQDRLKSENQRYTDNQNHVVSQGILHLTARRLPGQHPDAVNYESGMIRSDWTALYGFFEVRVKMPGGLGVWPAFWMTADVSSTGRLGWPPEIDFFEFVNNGRDDTRHMIHLGLSELPSRPNEYIYTCDAFHLKNRDYYAPYDFSEGWHTIAAEWTPDSVTHYIDGIAIVSRTYQWVFKDGEPGARGHILLNLAIGGPWAGRYGIDDSAFPQSFDVDWVRAYERI